MHDRPPSFDFGDCHVSIDHRSAVEPSEGDYLFVFTVTRAGVSTGYLRYLNAYWVNTHTEEAQALVLMTDLASAHTLRSHPAPAELTPTHKSLWQRLRQRWPMSYNPDDDDPGDDPDDGQTRRPRRQPPRR